MNSVIDNKLFDLITKIENFEFAYDISERFESIKQKLWDEFWNDLQSKLKNEHDDFTIEKISDWEFIFFQRKWKIFKFYFNLDSDYMQFGIGSNNVNYKKLFPNINEKFQEILAAYENEITENELWYYLKCDDDVTKLQGLQRILPANREKIISEYYGLFKVMLDDIYETVKNFEEKSK